MKNNIIEIILAIHRRSIEIRKINEYFQGNYTLCNELRDEYVNSAGIYYICKEVQCVHCPLMIHPNIRNTYEK